MLCSSAWPGTGCVAKAGLKLKTLLPQPPKCCNDRCVAPHLVWSHFNIRYCQPPFLDTETSLITQPLNSSSVVSRYIKKIVLWLVALTVLKPSPNNSKMGVQFTL
jgi:hypothetical protein